VPPVPPAPGKTESQEASPQPPPATPGPQASLVSPPALHEAPPSPPPAPPPAPAVDLRATIAQLDCALVTGDATSARKTLAGVLAKATSQNWSVESFARSPVFCSALDALRPAVAASGDAAADLQLKFMQQHAEAVLHDGDLVRIQVAMPDFDAWLTVDYISSDGGLAHMLPRSAGDQAYPPQHLAARTRRTLFEPAGAFKGWVAGEPYGTDMIIAVASAEKLPLGVRTDDEQQAGDYLRTLGDAIAAARKRGVAVAATAILVNTLPKQ
jgi:hypothetical protein